MTFTLLLAFFLITVAGQRGRRTYTQTIVNVKASNKCGNSIGYMTGNIAQCTAQCLKLTNECSLLEFNWESHTCYFYSNCTEVTVFEDFTSVRKTPRSDCHEVRVTMDRGMNGTCNGLVRSNAVGYDGCLPLCLDTADCRGATYSVATQECFLHDCDLKTLVEPYTYFWELECAKTRTIAALIIPPTTLTDSTSIITISWSAKSEPMSTEQSTTKVLAEEKMQSVGFFKKSLNIAVLSSVGGVLITAILCTCFVCLLVPQIADHIAEDHIHTDITCNIEEPQQKYRLGTEDARALVPQTELKTKPATILKHEITKQKYGKRHLFYNRKT